MHFVITIGNISLTYVRFVSPALTVETHTSDNKTAIFFIYFIGVCFCAPGLLSAARVRENWFFGSPFMARYYQSAVRCVNAQFCPFSSTAAAQLERGERRQVTAALSFPDGAPAVGTDG